MKRERICGEKRSTERRIRLVGGGGVGMLLLSNEMVEKRVYIGVVIVKENGCSGEEMVMVQFQQQSTGARGSFLLGSAEASLVTDSTE